MLLNKITALRANITITFAKEPAKESVYVGNIFLEKGDEQFTFDWNEHSCIYDGNVLLIQTRDLSTMAATKDATLEELSDAVVADLFLQGDDDSFVEGQTITDIELCLYDAVNTNTSVTLHKDAFRNADLGEYYDISWED